MAKVDGFEIPGNVTVSMHAIEQARMRFNDPEFEGLSDAGVAALLAEQVRSAVAAGQVYDVKPRSFRLYGEKGKGVTPWQRFVMRGERGWVIALDGLPNVKVLTSLVPQQKIRRAR